MENDKEINDVQKEEKKPENYLDIENIEQNKNSNDNKENEMRIKKMII